ncbi:hypothetical protein [Pseudomonas sp. Ga0074129]|uniref:hypothetical protein n=1 Tax=Pseudomonas sp. Ga0074129 TaxID=1752219 RepID=UPI0025EE969B|nr:hypothetical protein [Pseudomonas sp. Ga0074129]
MRTSERLTNGSNRSLRSLGRAKARPLNVQSPVTRRFMGFFSSLFSAASKKHQMIEWAIETLGREGSIVGTAYKEISYNDVQSYMQKSTCRPINSIKDAQNGWIDFEAAVKGQKYVVTLSRTFDGHGSVLTSKKA